MINFNFLVTMTIILLIVFVIILIITLIKRTKKLVIASLISLFIFALSGFYTAWYGLMKGVEKTFDIIQKVFPPFDSDVADTEANKKNFRNFLKVEITPDVKNIYCFDDAIGQDADYMFAFDCDSITAQRIIEEHSLKKDSVSGNYAEGMQHDFPWWNKETIRQLQSYSWHSELETKNFHKLFWYDEKIGKAYYFEYDM